METNVGKKTGSSKDRKTVKTKNGAGGEKGPKKSWRKHRILTKRIVTNTYLVFKRRGEKLRGRGKSERTSKGKNRSIRSAECDM